VVHHEPDGLAQALRPEPGPVAIPGHDQLVRTGRGSHHGPFGLTMKLHTFAAPAEPARGRIE
jgi:hypothetical protein